MNISQSFASNVIATEFGSLDEASVSRARWRVLDTIGCAVAGADAAGCRAMLDIIKKWGGGSESTVLVHGDKLPALNAAMMNSLMARSFDFEPVEAEGEGKWIPAHVSGATVPAALAIAERQGASGKDFITALAVGDDIACRLGVASGFDFNLGWDNTGTINAFGTTAIAGKLLGLNEKQLQNAFGIVLNQLGGSMDNVMDKTMAFKLPMALTVRNGIFSAELAGQGFVGVKDPFLGVNGYFKLYCTNYNTQDILKNLGKKFYADAVIKPYPTCRLTQSSIDSALKIAKRDDCKVTDIQEVEIKTTPGIFKGFCGQLFTLGETPQVDALFSIRYTIACALLRKDVNLGCFSEASINDIEIKKLIDKIKLLPGIPPEKDLATEIRVKMKNGQVLSASTDLPTGHIVKTPLSEEDIISKFYDNVTYSDLISRKKAKKSLEIILKLDELEDIRELTQLLVK